MSSMVMTTEKSPLLPQHREEDEFSQFDSSRLSTKRVGETMINTLHIKNDFAIKKM